MYEDLKNQAALAVSELIEKAKLKKGDLFVVGCSSSEIVGGTIGKNSSLEAAEAVFSGIYEVLEKSGIYLCAQCCEHLNRAVILERAAAEKYGYEIVNVVPQPKAGGSFAACCYKTLHEPAAVEHVKAHAGIDIGSTLIGMHLKEVAVPVRLAVKNIGQASVVCARTRPKFIGGERAIYDENNK